MYTDSTYGWKPPSIPWNSDSWENKTMTLSKSTSLILRAWIFWFIFYFEYVWHTDCWIDWEKVKVCRSYDWYKYTVNILLDAPTLIKPHFKVTISILCIFYDNLFKKVIVMWCVHHLEGQRSSAQWILKQNDFLDSISESSSAFFNTFLLNALKIYHLQLYLWK